MIDLDEKYQTTLDTWRLWSPYLKPKATVMFRCSNLQKTLVYANGKATGLGWDNDRGVIRAINDGPGIHFDETIQVSGKQNGWTFNHYPWGPG